MKYFFLILNKIAGVFLSVLDALLLMLSLGVFYFLVQTVITVSYQDLSRLDTDISVYPYSFLIGQVLMAVAFFRVVIVAILKPYIKKHFKTNNPYSRTSILISLVRTLFIRFFQCVFLLSFWFIQLVFITNESDVWSIFITLIFIPLVIGLIVHDFFTRIILLLMTKMEREQLMKNQRFIPKLVSLLLIFFRVGVGK